MGTIDLIWNGYSVTDERKQSADFTEPYMVNEQVLVPKSHQVLILFQECLVRPWVLKPGSSGYVHFMLLQKF